MTKLILTDTPPSRGGQWRDRSLSLRHAILPALLTILLSGAAQAVDVPLSGVDGTPDPGSGSGTSKVPEVDRPKTEPYSDRATIRGKVFYNDRRAHGLFAERFDKQRNKGTKCKPDSTTCSLNWLGGRYMVVDIIERDKGFAVTDFNCKKEEIIASATVGRDGSFVASFSTEDACKHDDLSYAAIQLKIRLRFCNGNFCFSANDKKNKPYSLSSANASYDNPMRVRGGDDITVPDMHFKSNSNGAVPDQYSVAANYYASIVDTILWLHDDNNIPFYYDDFGEVQFIFPSNKTKSGTTRGPDEVVINGKYGQPKKNGPYSWIKGEIVAHEYGHVLNLRAWGGDYGFKGIGKSANNNKKADSQQIGFKEAWAGFISRAVFQPTNGCDQQKFDDKAPKGVVGEGTWWRLNMIKALCDWYDDRDDPPNTASGARDDFKAENIYSMWYNLRRMYVDRAKYGGEYKKPGLWFCDYVKYYLDVRKSVAEVSRERHDYYVGKVRDLLYLNNIGCYLPAPS